MIINNVWAENVLKYSVLELNDIPEQGLIAVVGDNESGKSSIGESICFALFGRTFSLEPKDLEKVIRWGASRCTIKLDFTTPDGQRYQIARFLDELGVHGASISRAGEEPMVRGVDEVETRLKEIIGYGYTEFIESFYLAQREITTPHPHSFAVKAMAGVDALEKVAAACHEEIADFGENIVETETHKGSIDAQIVALNLQEGHLESLETQHKDEELTLEEDRRQVTTFETASDDNDRVLNRLKDKAISWLAVESDASFAERQAQTADLEQMLTDLKTQCGDDERTAGPYAELGEFFKESQERLVGFDGLREKAAAYRNRLGRLLDDTETVEAIDGKRPFGAHRAALRQQAASAVSSRRTSRILMILFLVLAVAAWSVWGLLSQAPESTQAETLARWLSGLSENWEASFKTWLPFIGGLLTVLFLTFLGRSISLSSRLQEYQRAVDQVASEAETARQEHKDLGELDNMRFPQAAILLSNLKDEQIAGQVPDFVAGPGAVLINPKKHTAHQGLFSTAVEKLEGGLSERKAATRREIEQLNLSITDRENQIIRLHGMIGHEEERVRRNEELTGISLTLGSKIKDIKHRIQVRNLAIDLLQGACYNISQRFNHDVRNLSADSLPKFTDGRYEHLQIDENLKVKAFSSEKRDFMDLDEISSGTQRQIMLAVRLALSQKLVNSVIHGRQMVFLDEPFAFFDERRTASALAVLPQVSGDFTQIWVTSQTFPQDSHFDMYVECNVQEAESPVVKRRGARSSAN